MSRAPLTWPSAWLAPSIMYIEKQPDRWAALATRPLAKTGLLYFWPEYFLLNYEKVL